MAKIKKGKIITVTSMKGGVGKTTTVLLLAAMYKNLGKSVLMIDLDLYSGSLAFMLKADVKNSIYNICDDMNNNRYKGLNNGEYICHIEDQIDLLASPKDPRQAGKVDKKCLKILMESVANYYDVILVDTNHSLNVYSMLAFDYSDTILDIFTNDAISLKGTRTFISICKNIKTNNLVVALNNGADDRKDYFSNYDIREVIGYNIDYIIPDSMYTRNYDMYVMEGSLLKAFSKIKSGKTYKSILSLATRLLEDNKKGVDENEEE